MYYFCFLPKTSKIFMLSHIMKNLNILIVEDEVLIAELFKSYLEEVGHTVVGNAISYDEAHDLFLKYRPDLILLDIRLYGAKSGIDFADFLKSTNQKTPFIFLSSQYDNHTLKNALETNPYGYLTKPISKESLRTSVSSAYQLFTSTHKTHEILLFDGRVNHLVNPSEILCIEADHIYVNVVLKDEKIIIVRESLKNILLKLPDDIFKQCHRSYIINSNFIKSWDTSELTLVNGKKIPISRGYKDGLKFSH